MSDQKLCLILESILALIETGNADKAAELIRNGIKRIDKGMTNSSENNKD